MDYRQIVYQPGTVARIVMNRPEYRNALSRVMLEEMDDAFNRAAADDGDRVIDLSGEGKDFCARHDIGSPPEQADRTERGYVGEYASLVQARPGAAAREQAALTGVELACKHGQETGPGIAGRPGDFSEED